MGVMNVGNFEEVRGKIHDFLTEGNYEPLEEFLLEVHYADLAEVLRTFALEERVELLRHIERERAAQVLFELDRDEITPLLKGLGRKASAQILQEMSADDAADLLGELPEDEQEQYLRLMSDPEAEDVAELLEYGAETAGGIMTTEFVAVNKELTTDEAIQILRRMAQEAETVYYVYVVNDQNQLVGVISLREMILAAPGARIEDVMRTSPLIRVLVDTDREEVARVVAKYDFLAVPVVNDQEELLGIVTVDDVLDVIEEEATEDYLRLASVHQERYLELGVLQRAGRRLPWLIALLFGALLAGSVVKFYEDTLAGVVALAFFMPVIAGGPGNVGTQTMAVMVRGLATGEVDARRVTQVIFKEIRVGMIVGVVSGLVLAAIATVWLDSALLGVVVGASLAAAMATASAIGTLFPLLINRMGVDPALASGPFITTVMDAISLMIYFTVASLIFFRFIG
jgi:magnesium transporter